jgi:hypothetical protein
VFSGISYAYYFGTNSFIFRIFSFISTLLFLVLIVIYGLRSLKLKTKNGDKPVLLTWYIIVTIIILVMSIRFNMTDIITLFFHPISFGAFFIGVVALLVNNYSIQFLVKMSSYINNLLPIITFLDIVLFKFPIFLVSCHTFLLFEYGFANMKRKKRLLLLMLSSLPLFLIYDYRSGILLTILFMVIIVSINFFKIFNSKFIIIVFLLGAISFIYYFAFNFTEVFKFITSFITGNEINTIDTRSFLYLEFFQDFKPSEYFFGRGYLGTYYSSYFDNWQGELGDSSTRFGVEIGFLQLLFKGGILLLGFTILIFIKSIYNGLFKSKPGSLSFLLSLWLIVELAMFAVQNIPEFTPHFFIIWIIIGILQYQKPKSVTSISS